MTGMKRAIRKTLLFHAEGVAEAGIDRLPIRGPSAGETAGPAAEPRPLEALRRRALACTDCPLHRARRRVVFGEGALDAALMFVGEAPGRDEDLSGRPFVGRAGQLLSRMIAAMGFDRSQVYIANVLKCRPPQNRTPAPDEIAACLPYLRRQIDGIAPRVIVALGAPAARTLLETDLGINALRGTPRACALRPETPVVPTFHPAYLLRREEEKPKSWQDLKLALRLLAGEESLDR